MAITKSAKKEIRSSERKRVFNLRRVRTMRKVIKEVMQFKKDGNMDKVKENIPKVQKAIDKAVKRGIIKPNTGARKKSRFIKAVRV